MKFKNILSIALPSLLASSAFSLPKDLTQLKTAWQSKEVLLTPYVSVSEVADDQSISDILMQRLNELVATGSAFRVEHTHESVRSKAIKSIFDGDKVPAFCTNIKAKPVIAKENKTPEQMQEAQERADLNQCKRTIEAVLDGIFHAHPQVYMLEEMRGEQRELHLYIESLTEQQKFLKYSFQK